MSIKEKIENNVVVWMLGTLLTGFLTGIGTYEGALEIMGLETISKERLLLLEERLKQSSSKPIDTGIYSVPLPDYLNSSELELILTRIKEAYNKRDTKRLYELTGPIGRAQITEEILASKMEPVFHTLGNIESGFFIQHEFMMQQGLYKNFILKFSIKYEKADKGLLKVTVIDDGNSYQIFGAHFTTN